MNYTNTAFKKSAKMGFIGELGMQAASGAVDAGLGLLLQSHNDRRQLRQQEKLNQQSLAFNQKLYDYQNSKQLEFWQKTNYPAQVEQLKKAGLNPALLYGSGGSGGAITGGGIGNAAPTGAPAGGGEIMGMQLMQAQRKLIEAQTKKTEADMWGRGSQLSPV